MEKGPCYFYHAELSQNNAARFEYTYGSTHKEAKNVNKIITDPAKLTEGTLLIGDINGVIFRITRTYKNVEPTANISEDMIELTDSSGRKYNLSRRTLCRSHMTILE